MALQFQNCFQNWKAYKIKTCFFTENLLKGIGMVF